MGRHNRSNDRPLPESERPTIDPYPDSDDSDFTVTFTMTATPEAAQRLDDAIQSARNTTQR
jgi:hypothetical protein